MDNWTKTIGLENLMKQGVITLDRGRVISSIDLAKQPGNFPVYSSSAQRNGFFGEYNIYDFDEELITWSVDGGGYFFYRPKHKFSVTNVSGILRIVDSKKYDYKFLYYLLVFQHRNQIYDYVDKAHPSVIKKRYFIPEIDILEQRQIATILSKVDEAINQTQQLIAKYSRIKTGLMQDLLTKGIDEKGNIRSEETHAFKDSPLGRIPVEWDWEALGDIYDLKSGITPLRATSKYFALEGYNWVKTLDLNEGDLFETQEKVTDFALQSTSLKLMPINSVLIAMYGGWEQIGRTSILKKEAGTNQAITCLLNPKKSMNSGYIQLFLQQNRWRWKQFAVSTRKDPNITKSDIHDFCIAFPIEINEQNKISESIINVRDNIKNFSDGLSKLQSIKTGLMQDLLSGKVKVNHLIKKRLANDIK
jgi:type I restriction enzyme S subunit